MKTSALRALLFLSAAVILPACGSSGSGKPKADTGVRVGAGGRTLRSGGGTGTVATGGGGGLITIACRTGAQEDILTGALTADTAFTIPTFTPYLGTNPKTLLTPGAATLTTVVGVTTILGDDNTNVATGLHVGPGVVLKITTNFPGAGNRNNVTLSFLNSIWNEGQISAALADNAVPGDEASNNGSALTLTGSNFVGSAGSSISTSGIAGNVGINAGGNGGAIFFQTFGDFVNRGTVSSNGAAGYSAAGNGGTGGTSTVYSNYFLYNAGNVSADGGDGVAAGTTGGSGGYTLWVASIGLGVPGQVGVQGGLFNSGNFTSRGGDGPAGGASGNTLQLFPNAFAAGEMGRLFNSGNFDASGGSATVGGNGGNGGFIQLAATGNILRCTGTFASLGGAGLGAASTGGLGGPVSLSSSSNAASGAGGGPAIEFAGSAVSASVDTRGGGGETGGGGGTITIQAGAAFENGTGDERPFSVVGYASINSDGGAGATTGGTAGNVNFNQQIQLDLTGLVNIQIGGLLNEVPISARGGNGTAGAGGAGGNVLIQDNTSMAGNDLPLVDRVVRNTGAVITSGGDGGTTGGAAGSFTLYDHFSGQNEGAITAVGGTGNTGNGGAGGAVSITSEQEADNSGAVTTSGGASTVATGGAAGGVTISTGTTTVNLPTGLAQNTGVIISVGGAGAAGGAGGGFLLYDHFEVVNRGAITTSGGLGGVGNGGFSGLVDIASDSTAKNLANIISNGGGSGTGNGGNSGGIRIRAQFSTYTGNATARGGSITTTGTGGIGGFVLITSTRGVSKVKGTMNVAPGTGTVGTPAPGHVQIDGIDKPLVAGVVTF